MAFNVQVTPMLENLPLRELRSKSHVQKNKQVTTKNSMPAQFMVDFLIDRVMCKYPVRIFDIQAQD
jgi:hypothetical protein